MTAVDDQRAPIAPDRVDDPLDTPRATLIACAASARVAESRLLVDDSRI